MLQMSGLFLRGVRRQHKGRVMLLYWIWRGCVSGRAPLLDHPSAFMLKYLRIIFQFSVRRLRHCAAPIPKKYKTDQPFLQHERQRHINIPSLQPCYWRLQAPTKEIVLTIPDFYKSILYLSRQHNRTLPFLRVFHLYSQPTSFPTVQPTLLNLNKKPQRVASCARRNPPKALLLLSRTQVRA